MYVRQALYHNSTSSLSLQLLLCVLPHRFTLCRKGTERKGSVQVRLIGEPVSLLVLISRAWAAQRKLCHWNTCCGSASGSTEKSHCSLPVVYTVSTGLSGGGGTFWGSWAPQLHSQENVTDPFLARLLLQDRDGAVQIRRSSHALPFVFFMCMVLPMCGARMCVQVHIRLCVHVCSCQRSTLGAFLNNSLLLSRKACLITIVELHNELFYAYYKEWYTFIH